MIMSMKDDIEGRMNTLGFASLAFNGAQFVPKVNRIPGIGPIGNIVSVGTSGIQGGLEEEAAMLALRQAYHVRTDKELFALAKTNSDLKRDLEEAGMTVTHSVSRAAIGAGGAAAGAAALAFIPGGMIIGGIGGNILTDYLYDLVKGSSKSEMGNIALALDEGRSQGQQVKAEELFLMSASNLPDNVRKIVEKEVQRIAGTTNFREALEKKDASAFTELMHTVDNEVRAAKGMVVRDPANPDGTYFDQAAEMLNANPNMPSITVAMNKADMSHVLALMERARMVQDQGADVSGMVNPDNRLPPQPANRLKGTKFSPSNN